MKISVIIPTLNEEKHIAATLRQVFDAEAGFDEVHVCDGGSQDRTAQICKDFPCRYLSLKRKGRGYQMHQGALQATGDIFFFMHADCILPKKAGHLIRLCLEDPAICAGGFSKVFDAKHPLLKGGYLKCKLRLKILKVISGDQGLFIKSSIYKKSGGYPDVGVMEEFFFCRQLKKFGRLTLLKESVQTSARRFLKYGVVRCYIRMLLVSLLYYLRMPPRLLERVYYSE